ncbi:MAG: hypothetical protein KDA60_05205 [Planctomycetales bacterium]|nr:hypothetical protein [Planctomycetales bacterium]
MIVHSVRCRLAAILCGAVLGSVHPGVAVSAKVVTYPRPPAEPPSDQYEVWVNGSAVDVYSARTLDAPFAGKQWDYGGPYSFANFDMEGTVSVRVRSTQPVKDVVIRPRSAGIQAVILDAHTITLTLDRPRKLSIEPNGRRGPLLLFANPLEADVPDRNDKDVVYYGPGVHSAGKIEIRSGQTLYLAGGAIVKGGIQARGDNIQIRGRGILDGSDWEWRKGPTPMVVDIESHNFLIEGITIRGASHWTIVPRHSSDVTIRNVKLCNSRVQNDDGINPCNSQRVLISDCFIRSDDDCVAMKGLDYRDGANNNVEDITVEDSVLWCDRARIFLLGHESRAEFMRRITLRNLDIIHFTMTPFLFEPGEEMRLAEVVVQDVRLHGEGQRELIRLRPVVNQYMRKQTPGSITDVLFQDVTLGGDPGGYAVQLVGADDHHDIQGIRFHHVMVLDRPLTEQSDNLQRGEFVDRVDFATGAP